MFPSTQELINIDRIENDTVVLKDGGLRKILLVSGVNLDLKSAEEQNLLIFGYQNFLNTLDFSLQTIVHSRKLNIDGYLQQLEKREEKENNKLLKNLMGDYRGFIDDFVAQNPIMTKTFFVVVPYDPIQVPKAGRKIAQKLLGMFGKKIGEKGKIKESFEKSSDKLNLRVSRVVDGLNRITLRVIPLAEEEIIELFYNFYNG